MSEMIERVARALAREILLEVMRGGVEEAQSYSLEKQAYAAVAAENALAKQYMALARAAIEAMREPTEAMLYASNGLIGHICDSGDEYRAMIDEALK